MRFLTISILAIGVGLGACRQPSAQEAGRAAASKQAIATAPMRCEDLKSINVANTTIAGAEIVAAGAFKPPAPGFPGLVVDYSKMPAFCRVTGSIKPSADSDIRVELWLPAEGWNGRFMQTGQRGAAGLIAYDPVFGAPVWGRAG